MKKYKYIFEKGLDKTIKYNFIRLSLNKIIELKLKIMIILKII